MDTLPTLTKQFEINFLKIIAEQLKKGEITLPDAKQAGKDFLTLLPFGSKEEMLNKIMTFCAKYPQFAKEYTILLTTVNEEKTSNLLTKLRDNIKEE